MKPAKLYYAYCWKSGLIQIGESVPTGAVYLAADSRSRLRKVISVLARHAYKKPGQKRQPLLVPGIPEASDLDAAMNAVDAFSALIESRLDKKKTRNKSRSKGPVHISSIFGKAVIPMMLFLCVLAMPLQAHTAAQSETGIKDSQIIENQPQSFREGMTVYIVPSDTAGFAFHPQQSIWKAPQKILLPFLYLPTWAFWSMIILVAITSYIYSRMRHWHIYEQGFADGENKALRRFRLDNYNQQ